MPLNKPPNQTLQQFGSLSFRGRELRFALVFLIVFVILQYGYSASRGSVVEWFVIDIATVRPSVAVINLIAPQEQAQANGHRIIAPQGGLNILNGCEGTESMFLLLAAIVAFTSPWLRKLKGALIGILLVYVLNQVRIIALYFVAHHDKHWFDLLHGYIAPTLIIVLSSVFFLWWAGNSAADNVEPAKTK